VHIFEEIIYFVRVTYALHHNSRWDDCRKVLKIRQRILIRREAPTRTINYNVVFRRAISKLLVLRS